MMTEDACPVGRYIWMRAEFYYGAVMLMGAGALNCHRTLMQNPPEREGK